MRTTSNKLVDSKGRTIEAERVLDVPTTCTHDSNRVRTIGRLYYSARRWSWATRFELRGDMAVKDLDGGSRFEPVEQLA